MSITETYYLAHAARKKLTREANRSDHDLRLLVGHANMLDSLMLDLADAEQDQERWFNETVSGAVKASQEKPQHIQWAETVVDDSDEDWDPEDLSDVDSDYSDSDEEDAPVDPPVRRRAPSPVAVVPEELDEESDSDSEFEYDIEEDLSQLTLTRSPSRHATPELSSDSDDESDDDMPPSPPQPTLDTFHQDSKGDPPLSDSEQQPGLFDAGYYIPHQPQSTLIKAC